MKSVITLLLLSLFLFAGCKDEPTPPQELPEGYQQDIPWPSLADSPWPLVLGNAQGANRTKCVGPTYGIIEWVNEDFKISGGLTIGTCNEIYGAAFDPKSIFRLNSRTGLQTWSYDSLFSKYTIDIHTCPIVLNDGTLITSNGSGQKVFALTSDGKLLWTYSVGNALYNAAISVDRNGVIYFIDKSKTLHALSKSGILLWKVQDTRFSYGTNTAIVFSPDGNTIYFQGADVGIVAFDLQTVSVKWTFGENTWYNYPLVDSQGLIYILSSATLENNSSNLYCLNPDGLIRWSYSNHDIDLGNTVVCLSMNSMGDIYYADYDSLFCVNYEGKLKFRTSPGSQNPILIDGNDDLYLFCNNSAMKRNKAGDLIWKIDGLDKIRSGYGCLSNGSWIISSWQYTKYIISIK